MNATPCLPGLLDLQPRAATDEELLCLLLCGTSSFQNRPLFEMAQQLLRRCGGWKGLVGANETEIVQIAGIGPDKLGRLSALREIHRRLTYVPSVDLIRSSREAARFLKDLGELEQEVVGAIYLRANQEVIAVREIFRGTVQDAPAQPREILREALKANAAKLILAHNHLCSSLLPSEEDLRFTARLQWSAEAIGIPLLDHLIVGKEGAYFSFADSKLLAKSSARPWRKRYGRLPSNPSRYSQSTGSRLGVCTQ